MFKKNNKIKKKFVGYVISNKMKKTIIVKVEIKKKHFIYNKYIKYFKKFKAHDEKNISRIGDLVKIIETRPLSATKFFCLYKILSKKKNFKK